MYAESAALDRTVSVEDLMSADRVVIIYKSHWTHCQKSCSEYHKEETTQIHCPLSTEGDKTELQGLSERHNESDNETVF